MPKNHSREAIEAAQRALGALHPDLFSLEDPVPLSLTIRREIRRRYPAIPFPTLMTLLRWLTNRRAYLRACVAGADRHGFDGPDGCVTEEQAAYARARYAERMATEALRMARAEEGHQAAAE